MRFAFGASALRAGPPRRPYDRAQIDEMRRSVDKSQVGGGAAIAGMINDKAVETWVDAVVDRITTTTTSKATTTATTELSLTRQAGTPLPVSWL